MTFRKIRVPDTPGGREVAVDETARGDVQLTKLVSGGEGEANQVNPATEETLARRFAPGAKLTRAVQISSSGDNTARTPALGKFLRLHWIGLNAKDDSGTEVLAIVKFGNAEHYRWNLGSPGAFAHWEVIDGAVDVPLVVNLSAARVIQVNYTVEEI